jgi:hypothetical protein
MGNNKNKEHKIGDIVWADFEITGRGDHMFRKFVGPVIITRIFDRQAYYVVKCFDKRMDEEFGVTLGELSYKVE